MSKAERRDGPRIDLRLRVRYSVDELSGEWRRGFLYNAPFTYAAEARASDGRRRRAPRRVDSDRGTGDRPRDRSAGRWRCRI